MHLERPTATPLQYIWIKHDISKIKSKFLFCSRGGWYHCHHFCWFCEIFPENYILYSTLPYNLHCHICQTKIIIWFHGIFNLSNLQKESRSFGFQPTRVSKQQTFANKHESLIWLIILTYNVCFKLLFLRCKNTFKYLSSWGVRPKTEEQLSSGLPVTAT